MNGSCVHYYSLCNKRGWFDNILKVVDKAYDKVYLQFRFAGKGGERRSRS